jgi:hypothetical protein
MSTQVQSPLSACMVDGFGRFREADYRRCWLMFDDVTYVLSRQLREPFAYRPEVTEALAFSVDRSSFDDATAAQVARAAREDAEDESFKQLMVSVPRADAETAGGAVMSDVQAYEALKLRGPPSESLAVAYLLNKLVSIASTTHVVPLVGRGFAADMIAWKSQQGILQRSESLPGRLLQRPSLRTRYAAFAAGLSYGFIDDEDLVQAPIELLAQFKKEQTELRKQSQKYILDASMRFSELPSDEVAFQAELAKLRQDVLAQRSTLEKEASRALLDAGVKIGAKALTEAVKGFAGGLALTSHLLPASIAAAVTAAVGVVPDAIQLVNKVRGPRSPSLAYMFRIGKTFSLEAAALGG